MKKDHISLAAESYWNLSDILANNQKTQCPDNIKFSLRGLELLWGSVALEKA